ncbi:GntR family transcriptional regulator [Streptomyces sp. NBC_00439]|uniref:GntR family transcriptional regulator n=1 Tax=unclassified Streptomyces TaxID=2593676 RepID=UPI00224F3323|nr:GntR family transcriptional regulator [Streptomyces sp. NBC_00439]MCX5103623.1 GntR family transcriptional regulator [Streptomyces sp. NBC_00439]WSX06228.1 GntR family transcriptional regulator [Streptomyces sp. NBC_00987]
MLTSNARGLLGALVEAGQPGLQVHEISEHVVKAVADGTYGQGTAHSVKTVAAALETPVSRVALAFDDLARAGIINVSVAGRATVVGGTSPSAGRATDVAAWLTALIQAGVYPAGTPLPPIPRLSTAFVAHKTDVRAALRILQQSRVVQCRRKAVARVEMALPFPADAPPDPLRLAKRLRTTKSAPDLDFDTAVSAAARRARNWWRSRTNVDPDVLSRHIDVMRLMAGHLLPMATSQVTCCEDEVVLRRAAVTACLPWPEEAKGRSWRAACLGTALTELLLIKSRPAPPPPEGPRTTASTSGFLAQP